MKTTELGIGNLIYINNGQGRKIKKVKSLSENEINHIRYKSKLCEWKFEPIPIAKQWLLDLKFKERDNHQIYYIDCGEYLMEVVINGFSGTLEKEAKWFVSIYVSYGNHPITIMKMYIHELQNLYYVLSGKELTTDKSH